MAPETEAQIDQLLTPEDRTSWVDAAIWKPAGGWRQFPGRRGREKGRDRALEDKAIRPAVCPAQSPSLRGAQRLQSRRPGCRTGPAREMLQTTCGPHGWCPPNRPGLPTSKPFPPSLPPTVAPHYGAAVPRPMSGDSPSLPNGGPEGRQAQAGRGFLELPGGAGAKRNESKTLGGGGRTISLQEREKEIPSPGRSAKDPRHPGAADAAPSCGARWGVGVVATPSAGRLWPQITEPPSGRSRINKGECIMFYNENSPQGSCGPLTKWFRMSAAARSAPLVAGVGSVLCVVQTAAGIRGI